jgi:hypothetical protein
MEYIKSLFSKTQQKKQIGFEDVKYAICHMNEYLLINTMSILEQDCLIYGTMAYNKEEAVINSLIENGHTEHTVIIIYGKNSADDTVAEKYDQLKMLGFFNIYIYGGGIFEWLLLQDIYGNKEFPTSGRELDMLKHRVLKTFSNSLLLT